MYLTLNVCLALLIVLAKSTATRITSRGSAAGAAAAGAAVAAAAEGAARLSAAAAICRNTSLISCLFIFICPLCLNFKTASGISALHDPKKDILPRSNCPKKIN